MKFTGYIAAALLVSAGMQAMAQTADEATPNVMVVSTPYHEYVFGIKDIDRIIFRYQDNVPDPENYEQYKNDIFDGAYYYLHGWFGRDFDEGVMNQGDDLMAICYTQGNYYDDGRGINGSIHCLTLDNWNCKMLDDIIAGCNYCSQLIETYGGADANDPSIAQVRAIRAYYHFWGMEMYGDVPICDHVIGNDEVVARMPRAQVAEFIATELEELLARKDASALSKNNDASTYGKPNYWMACALLAKLYLNWGVYTNPITEVTADTPNPKLNRCVELCDELMTCGLFEVGTGYRKKFFPDNGVHIKDFIYAYNVDNGEHSYGTKTWMRWYYYKLKGQIKPQIYGWDVSKSTAGIQVLTPEAAAKFNLPGDERNDMILKGKVFQFDNNYNVTDIPVMLYTDDACTTEVFQLEFVPDFEWDDPSVLSLGGESEPGATPRNISKGIALLNSRKGARCFKYPAKQSDYDNYNRQQENDYPIFRLADIVLMKAECLLRGATPTNGDTPASLMNIVRRCSGAPEVTGDVTVQDLMDERLREFIQEPWRRNDLIRNGMFEDDWGAKNGWYVDGVWHERLAPDGTPARDKRHRLMPLHRMTLEANPTWQQNPGYAGL